MARPDLHVVPAGQVGSDAPATKAIDPRAPEDMLGFLFTREKTLVAELAEVRRALDAQRIRYSDRHGLRVRVGINTLRRLFG
jgi:hypothetical protein